MFKETLGAAVLGITLASAPGAAAAAPGESSASTVAAAKREALTVRIDTDRRGRQGYVRILVREADDRDPARGIWACLQERRGGDWRTFACERTNRRGWADWFVRAHRDRAYRVYIPESREYYPYYSDRFRFDRDRDWWDRGNRFDDDRRGRFDDGRRRG